MALDKVKTEAGSCGGTERWNYREFVKLSARKRRRQQDKKEARRGREE